MRNKNHISFETAMEILRKLMSESIPVVAWHVFPHSEFMVHGLITGITKDALLVRADPKDDLSSFMSVSLIRKFHCVHGRVGSKYGQNQLFIIFRASLYLRVLYTVPSS